MTSRDERYRQECLSTTADRRYTPMAEGAGRHRDQASAVQYRLTIVQARVMLRSPDHSIQIPFSRTLLKGETMKHGSSYKPFTPVIILYHKEFH